MNYFEKYSYFRLLLLIIFAFNNLVVVSQINIPILTKNTINLKLENSGKPVFLKILGFGEMYESLTLFNIHHYKNIEIKCPMKLDENEVAIAEISSKNTNNLFIIETIYLLIVNYKTSNPIIYLSKTGNLDFKIQDKIIDKNHKVAKFDIKTKKGSIEYIIDLTKNKNSRNTLTSIDDLTNTIDDAYSIPIWQNNIKYGVIPSLNDSINIAVFDENNNGVFGDNNIDMIILNTKNESSYFTLFENSSAKKVSANNFIRLSDSSYYDIFHIDQNGNFLLLESKKGTLKNDYIKAFDDLPSLDFLSTDSTYINLKQVKTNDKYFYLNILTEYCAPCINKIPDIERIAIKYNCKLNILSLLDNANFKDLKYLTAKHKITSSYGLSNSKINYAVKLNGYPYGILFDKNRHVIKEIRNVDELEDFIKSHE